jgi:hypothetical protein
MIHLRARMIACGDLGRADGSPLGVDASFGLGIEGDRGGWIAADFGSTLAVVSSVMGLNGLFDNPAVSK